MLRELFGFIVAECPRPPAYLAVCFPQGFGIPSPMGIFGSHTFAVSAVGSSLTVCSVFASADVKQPTSLYGFVTAESS